MPSPRTTRGAADTTPAPAAGSEPTAGANGAGAADAAALERCLSPQIADAVRIAGGLSIAAGIIHAMAMIDHFSHYWLYGVFFLLLTYGQVLWGVALLRKRCTERMLRLGALANAAIIVLWIVSRAVGMPFGPDAGDAEAIGSMDVAVTLDQIALIAYIAVVLRPRLRGVRGLRALLGRQRIRLGMMLGSATVFTAMLGGHQH
ncbi:MAG: hypothetical protein WKF96_13385 [Solirubrobacteraceae bacterium]